jgi:hypothetical protein
MELQAVVSLLQSDRHKEPEKARNFQEAYENAGYAGDDTVAHYLTAISVDGRAWVRSLPAKATGKSTLDKHLSAIRLVLNVEGVRQALGADNERVRADIADAFGDRAFVESVQLQRRAAKESLKQRGTEPGTEPGRDDEEARIERLERLETENKRLLAKVAEARAALLHTAKAAVLCQHVAGDMQLREAAAAGMQVAAEMM